MSIYYPNAAVGSIAAVYFIAMRDAWNGVGHNLANYSQIECCIGNHSNEAFFSTTP
jgi:hypothetical protein